MNVELLDQIEADSSKLSKENLLQAADGDLRLFIEQCLDPDITYGVTVNEDEELRKWRQRSHLATPNPKSLQKFWDLMKQMLDQFAKRSLTGNSALYTMEQVLAACGSETHLKWACRFINKNLRAGFDIRTYNNVFGEGTVKKFAVQLADVYETQPLPGLWFFQPKLDGNRVVLIDGKAMSRNGKEYPNCQHVIDELLQKDPDFFENWVIDGEMMGDLGFDKSSGALRRINEKNREKATFTYWAFDLIRRKEWETHRTSPLSQRKLNLEGSILKDMSTVKIVPTTSLVNPTHQQVMDLCEKYLADGFEGAMAKDSQSPYVFKRGKNLLKVKKFFDGDFEIVDLYEGKGKHKGRLGGIIVTDGKTTSKCGSGFDDGLRDLIWANKKDWMHAIVQVQYQEKTKDGSLRFPVFIMRRKDKE